jgi:hypothetical protein
MVNKKGQEMSISTLLLIVIGIVVLVLVVLGFSMGWSNLLEKINFINPSTNIDSLAQNCNLALVQPSAFCEYKSVTFDGKSQYVNCRDSRILGKLQGSAPSNCADNTEKMFCASLVAGGKDVTNTLVNNKLCSAYT